MKIKPLIASGGYVISGDAKRLEVKVDLGNLGENAYNIMLDMLIYGNLSMEELRTQDTGTIPFVIV